MYSIAVKVEAVNLAVVVAAQPMRQARQEDRRVVGEATILRLTSKSDQGTGFSRQPYDGVTTTYPQ